MTNPMDILTPDNHTLYRRIQHLVRLKWEWEEITEDVGIYPTRSNVHELCEWVLDYKTPKELPVASDAFINKVPVKKNKVAENTAQFIAWKRAKEGAKAALAASNSE